MIPFSSSALDDTQSLSRSYVSVIIASIIFHGIVLVAIPLSANLLRRSRKFKRPQTFQLVQAKSISKPQPQLKKTVAAPKPKPAVKPAVKTKKSIPKPKPKKAPPREPEEDLSELEDLLGGIPQPPSELKYAGSFPYPWYERNIMMKVEQHWKPSVYREDIFVLVAFVIFRNGTISDVRVKKSSGDAMLDNLALRAIKMAAPFGKLPPGYTKGQLAIDYKLLPTRK